MSAEDAGFDPSQMASLEAKMEAAVALHDVAALSEICRGLISIQRKSIESMGSLGSVVWPLVDAVTTLSRRLDRVEDALSANSGQLGHGRGPGG